MSTPCKVLVVDDQPVNVQLLRRALERENLTVLTAMNGPDALAQVERELPDIILLDVMMPEMDGIEVCQRLKAHPIHKTVPVMFITARNSREGKLAGLGVGAVDYITKPIDLDETVARVQTQLRVVRINREMLDLQHRLQEARRTAAVGAITQGIAHNLNNILGVVMGYLDLIRVNAAKPNLVLSNAENLDNAVKRIVAIIRQLSSLVVKSRLPTSARPLDELIASAVGRLKVEVGPALVLTIDNPLGDLAIDTHLEVFEDSLLKLLVNAYESYGCNFHAIRPITVRTSLVPPRAGTEDALRMLCIKVIDQGQGIAPGIRDQLFEPFISSKNTVGVGMGLTVARHSLRNMGGDVHLTENPGGGVTAHFTHPIERPERGTNFHG